MTNTAPLQPAPVPIHRREWYEKAEERERGMHVKQFTDDKDTSHVVIGDPGKPMHQESLILNGDAFVVFLKKGRAGPRFALPLDKGEVIVSGPRFSALVSRL